ncbi:polysaccharide deacetylase family protein [Desulfocapsa sulfexigens]|nr:polysaccharide deacetylase family protein [Desulfocapsa sulfexigens]
MEPKNEMISALYTNLPDNTEQLLKNALEKGLAHGSGEAKIFFRADDIGVPGKQFSHLAELFIKHRLPLCLAVVPTWLTATRFITLQSLTKTNSSQWCWHQHGWLHRNHETKGKKQEFGPARSVTEQIEDLKNGKNRLETLLEDNFSPFFTPPWNRCSLDTLKGLQHLGFKAVSRSIGAKPVCPHGLPDLQVNIDLHTRKEVEPEISFNTLLQELERGISSGTGGVMIHHQRMDTTAFEFLDLFLKTITSFPAIHPLLFRELI